MSIDVQAHLGHVGNVSRVDGSAVDNLETAGILEGVQRKVVLLCKVFVDKSEARGAAVDQ